MFDTAFAMLVSWLFQLLCLVLQQAWQHPLFATGLCLLVGSFSQADDQMRREVLQQLRMRWQRVATCLSLFTGNNKLISGNKYTFDYGLLEGPHTWTHLGGNQSPINIDEQHVQRLAIHELLIWNHYDELPLSIVLENTGQTLLLRAEFRSNVPTISGADLLASYTFVELSFHWGWSNSEGSEHTLNNRKYPLEVQVLHRTGAAVPSKCTSSYDLLMVAYIYELSAHNPYIDPLMQNLKLVQQPGKRVRIAPFPLSYLVYPFRSGFYSYGGSLTTPPCYQGIEWFIFPESLAISDFQLRHFRQLLGGDGFTPISRNSRPVQPLGNRVINLNYFCPYDAEQLERFMQLQRQKEQVQEQEQVHEQAQEQEVEKEVEEEPPLPLPNQPKSHPQLVPFQSNVNVSINPEEEGLLVESLDSTTTITTNASTSICTTVLPQKLASCCPNSIIFFSSTNSSKNSTSNTDSNGSEVSSQLEKTSSNNNKNSNCSNNTGHFQLNPVENMMIHQFNIDVGNCGNGDSLTVPLIK